MIGSYRKDEYTILYNSDHIPADVIVKDEKKLMSLLKRKLIVTNNKLTNGKYVVSDPTGLILKETVYFDTKEECLSFVEEKLT